jgi:hypothetical protein
LKTLVVGSCGKKKRSTNPQAPEFKDLTSMASLKEWRARIPKLLNPTRDMYSGNQSRELVRGVDLQREIKGIEVAPKLMPPNAALLLTQYTI